MIVTGNSAHSGMKAAKILPPSYLPYRVLNLANWKIMLLTNAAGIVLLFFFGWIFMGLAAALQPQFFVLGLTRFARTLSPLAFVVTAVTVIVLHELAHALFFWLFTRERPKIGFNLLYAYAAAPDWYFPRNHFVLIGLAPLLLITLAGGILMFFVDFMAIPRLVLALTINAAGAIGDMMVVGWLLAQPAAILIRDQGTAITLYREQQRAPGADQAHLTFPTKSGILGSDRKLITQSDTQKARRNE